MRIRKRYILALLAFLFVISCAGATWHYGRCEVVLTRDGIPLAGATVTVLAGSRWAGVYTLDDRGRWNMGWHLFERPKGLSISITDEKWKSGKSYLFTFPKNDGWTIDFSGPYITQTRSTKSYVHVTRLRHPETELMPRIDDPENK